MGDEVTTRDVRDGDEQLLARAARLIGRFGEPLARAYQATHGEGARPALLRLARFLVEASPRVRRRAALVWERLWPEDWASRLAATQARYAHLGRVDSRELVRAALDGLDPEVIVGLALEGAMDPNGEGWDDILPLFSRASRDTLAVAVAARGVLGRAYGSPGRSVFRGILAARGVGEEARNLFLHLLERQVWPFEGRVTSLTESGERLVARLLSEGRAFVSTLRFAHLVARLALPVVHGEALELLAELACLEQPERVVAAMLDAYRAGVAPAPASRPAPARPESFAGTRDVRGLMAMLRAAPAELKVDRLAPRPTSAPAPVWRDLLWLPPAERVRRLDAIAAAARPDAIWHLLDVTRCAPEVWHLLMSGDVGSMYAPAALVARVPARRLRSSWPPPQVRQRGLPDWSAGMPAVVRALLASLPLEAQASAQQIVPPPSVWRWGLESEIAYLARLGARISGAQAARLGTLRARLSGGPPPIGSKQVAALVALRWRATLERWHRLVADQVTDEASRCLDLRRPDPARPAPLALPPSLLAALLGLHPGAIAVARRLIAHDAAGLPLPPRAGSLERGLWRANDSVIAELRRSGLRTDAWLGATRPPPRPGVVARLLDRLEPILEVGAPFCTCLAPGEQFFDVALTIAASATHRVLVIEDARGEVRARAVLGLAVSGALRFYRPYAHDPEAGADLERAVVALARDVGCAVGARLVERQVYPELRSYDGPLELPGTEETLRGDAAFEELVVRGASAEAILAHVERRARFGLLGADVGYALDALGCFVVRPALREALIDCLQAMGQAEPRRRVPTSGTPTCDLAGW